MRLTRRDAVLGVAAGLTGGAGLAALDLSDTGESQPPGETGALDDDSMATLVALAEVVYPSSVDATPEFVAGYTRLLGPDRTEQVRAATAELDAVARSVAGRPFAALPRATRESVLKELGVGNVTPRQQGTRSARVRYHLVNGLLLALFTSPKGSRLLGVENPLGHPGGYHGVEGVSDGQ